MARKEDVAEGQVLYGGENVFDDLGLPDSQERLAKAKLASAIQDVIEERGLTQVEAADLMGIDQPKVSKVIRGNLQDFSTERLMYFLRRLGLDVEIVIHKAGAAIEERHEGSIRVAMA